MPRVLGWRNLLVSAVCDVSQEGLEVDADTEEVRFDLDILARRAASPTRPASSPSRASR
jgi:hypothetical protein